MSELLALLTGGGSSVYAWLAGLLTLVGSAFGLYLKGSADRARKQKLKTDEADLKMHKRMNHAETGSGMSDQQRADWLRDFGNK